MSEKKPTQYEDRLSKYLLGGLFWDKVHVEVGSDLLPDSFRADVLLIPDTPLADVPGAGLLTRLTGDARCLLEAFSGMVQEVRVEANLAKLRLALLRSHQDKLGVQKPKGVLWLVTTYWPQNLMLSLFGNEGELVERGLRRWQGFEREVVYLVNTHELELREETLLFGLLGKGRQRNQAVLTIFHKQIEPYVHLLNAFDRSFLEMTQTPMFQSLDPEIQRDLKELRDTRQEVLLELGKAEGKEIGLSEGKEIGLSEGKEIGLSEGKEIGLSEGERRKAEEIARRMLVAGLPLEQVAEFTGLAQDDLRLLQTPTPS